MAADKDTSITITAARNFITKASEREYLSCRKITGFHLLKLKRGGAWRYRYTDKAGKRRVATVGKFPAMKPEQAAERALDWRNNSKDVLADKERERRHAIQAAALAESRTLGAYLDGSYADHQARKKTGSETLAIIRGNFPELLERDMATLASTDIKAWQKRREGEGRAHATLQRAFGALKTCLNQATREDPPLLKENPLAKATLQAPPNDPESKDKHIAATSAREIELQARRKATRRLLTDEELERLYGGLEAFAERIRQQRRNTRKHGRPNLPDLDSVAYPHWFIPFALTALYTGFRPGDLYSLKWTEEVNLTFGRIVKTPEKTRHHQKPAEIVMDMIGPLREVLKAWHEQHGEPDTGLVFPSPVTGLKLDSKSHRKPWRHIKKLGGLPDDLTFYSCRHHFISRLVAGGVPLLTVAKLCGHKSAQMIESHYGHLCPKSAADAMDIFAKSLRATA